MELMLTEEVGVMVGLLEEAGAKVVVASLSGKPIRGDPTTLAPDLKLSDVSLDDYAGVVIPCMAAGFGGDPGTLPPEALKIVKEAVAQGKPVAAQQSAVLILAKAGVLDGRRFAIAAENRNYIAVGTFAGAGVVRAGRIVTAGTCPLQAQTFGLPDTTTELTRRFIALMASVK
jgi:putative intracellular protease/amidase